MSTHLAKKPVLESLYRKRYCGEEPQACARYQVAAAGPHDIPDDLLPNQHDRLRALGVEQASFSN